MVLVLKIMGNNLGVILGIHEYFLNVDASSLDASVANELALSRKRPHAVGGAHLEDWCIHSRVSSCQRPRAILQFSGLRVHRSKTRRMLGPKEWYPVNGKSCNR